MKYSMCFLEWEERNPWGSMHVERGFDKDESVVSVFAMSSGPVQIIDQTSLRAEQLVGSFALSMRAVHNVRAHRNGDVVLVISPEHVDTISRDGWSKADIRARIQEVSSIPLKELVADDISGAGISPRVLGQMSEEKQNAMTPKFATAEQIHIVVAGSEAGKFSAVFHGWASGSMGSIPDSKQIQG